MKFLLVSDLHYALRQFDWVTQVAEGFDLVVIAGDLLDVASTVDKEAQIIVMLKYLRRLRAKTRLLVSSGNHDLNGENAHGEQAARWMSKVAKLGIPTDGDSVTIEQTLFTICPWWDGPSTREEVGALLARDAARAAEHWVWVYHAPPTESPTSWTGREHIGDEFLSAWIQQYQPAMVLCGHIHQSPFKSDGSWVDRIGRTWVFNSGNQIGPAPAHVVLDVGSHEAKWFSLAGAEIVQLDAALQRPVAEYDAAP